MATKTYDRARLVMRLFVDAFEDDLLVDAAPGLRVPASFEAELEHPDWPTKVHAYVGYSRDTGPVLNGLRADMPTVSLAEINACLSATIDRTTLLDAMTGRAASFVAAMRARAADPGIDDTSWWEISNRVFEEALPIVSRRRYQVTDDHLAEVAKVYRAAVEGNLPPTKAVAKHFTVSHSTAARWVGMARQAGHLGPALGKRAGEATHEARSRTKR